MKLIIEIDTDNAAFQFEAGSEVARILRKLAGMTNALSEEFLREFAEQRLWDRNGNVVGKVIVR